jgi:D-alanine-D-alanine ligase
MGSTKKKRVVLLKGGMGAERDVSLATAQGFEAALKELGYPYEVIDCKENFLEEISKAKNIFKAEVALLALHGKFAEDGVVQGICEYIKLPYSGAGVMSSALCMDKIYTKEILVNHDIPTPEYQVVEKKDLTSFKLEIEIPLVVKPSREGSSVGVTIVKDAANLQAALQLAAKYDNYILLEKYIAGMELTVPILDGKVLTPIEIVPKVDFYDYKNKYTAGCTDYILPPRLDEKSLNKAKDYAMKAFVACRIRTYGRIDFRVDTNGNPYIMEINTLPGCTPTSLLPKSAKASGISFNQLIEILVERATLDYAGVK